jgi:hypothetical protein
MIEQELLQPAFSEVRGIDAGQGDPLERNASVSRFNEDWRGVGVHRRRFSGVS